MVTKWAKSASGEVIRVSDNLTIALSKAKRASFSLLSASGDAIPVVLSRVALNRAKAKAHLFGEAISQALSGSAKTTSIGEASTSYALGEASSPFS